jgi:hypothetical protein
MISLPGTVAFVLAAGVTFIAGSPAYGCDDVSIDGCPAIAEVDNNVATFTGGPWFNSTARLLYYGDNYRPARGSGSSAITATATFRPGSLDTEVDCTYSVYARWAVDPNRCTAARYEIYDGSNLIATRTANQRVNGGAWQRLGTFRFTPGNIPSVRLTNAGCPSNNFVIADAVRWVQEDQDRNSIVDEPGLDWAGRGSRSLSTVATCDSVNWTNLATVTITAPRNGWVLVEASGIALNTVASGQYSRVGIDDLSTGKAIDSLAPFFENSAGVTGSFENERRFAVRKVYSVAQGSRSFYLKGCKSEFAGGNLQWDDFTAIYFPTRY